ncbi:hypothetical protein AVEN_207180-1 [Araneus ventricosus]|uniref:Uncharacterized protein n=1 Tax=Araneus ventricosus TaxID=182803 RepID=A0A4Y2HU09_ARAVE|nr:hypothetical protein AVEN_207180-1 [Araneus ventricosus]
MQYLESERSKEKTETKQLKRKALEEEIDFLKQKKVFLQTDMHQTNEKANDLANEAEKSKDINLFIQSHELRKTISEKEIKINTLDDGARHLWHFFSSSRYLPKEYLDIIEPVISCNTYLAAQENMLLAILTDERCHVRIFATRRIIKARKIDPNGNCVSRFVIPAVNFGATDYVDLVDWQACYVTPPPVLRQISSHELLKMI